MRFFYWHKFFVLFLCLACTCMPCSLSYLCLPSATHAKIHSPRVRLYGFVGCCYRGSR
jgi:hypothetical protein